MLLGNRCQGGADLSKNKKAFDVMSCYEGLMYLKDRKLRKGSVFVRHYSMAMHDIVFVVYSH